jgi:hypothetical protein
MVAMGGVRRTSCRRAPDRVGACRVIVEAAHRHDRQGNICHVRVDLAVPDGRNVVNRAPSEDRAHDDLHVAIRDAFAAVRRRLHLEAVRKTAPEQ